MSLPSAGPIFWLEAGATCFLIMETECVQAEDAQTPVAKESHTGNAAVKVITRSLCVSSVGCEATSHRANAYRVALHIASFYQQRWRAVAGVATPVRGTRQHSAQDGRGGEEVLLLGLCCSNASLLLCPEA